MHASVRDVGDEIVKGSGVDPRPHLKAIEAGIGDHANALREGLLSHGATEEEVGELASVMADQQTRIDRAAVDYEAAADALREAKRPIPPAPKMKTMTVTRLVKDAAGELLGKEEETWEEPI